jgi:hypothetical protein
LEYKVSRRASKANSMLNRTSPWADVNSYAPYTGRVEVKVKQPLSSVRTWVANWVDKAQVGCRVSGEARRIT